ncbi:MAG: hypothetical protein CL910_08095 [Deltaproteobacteria bacterium]|nr:hypothetical protein [Deltaproteobacteria bacterium]
MLSFASPVAAFGFDVNALDIDWTMVLFDSLGNTIGSFVIANQPGQGLSGFGRRGYAGASSAVPVASVRIGNPGSHDWALIDNIAIAAVPEASSASVLGLALLGLGLRRARSRSRAAA